MSARAEGIAPVKPVKMDASRIKTELLAGLTVALALVPEAVAFAFVAGVNPLVGLYAAFFVGLITACIGGRPGMISGATGALAVVMVALVAQHGVEYLFATVVLMGILQIGVGLLKWGKFIRMVPHPVMLGFVNGLAIVIFLAQLGQFKVPDGAGGLTWMSGSQLYLMLGLIALTMAVIWFLPSALPRRFRPRWPAFWLSLALVLGFDLDTRSVGDLASIAGGLPQFHIPMVPLTFETLQIILPYAVILSAIGLIESLLTLNLVADLTNTKGGASKECVAQGTATCRHRLLRRHGRLCHDRPVDDQREVRRPDPHLRHCGRAVPPVLYRGRLAPDRADPGCRARRRDVHGGHRHLRLGQPEDRAQDPADRRAGDGYRHLCHRLCRPGCRRGRRRHHLCSRLCLERGQPHQCPHRHQQGRLEGLPALRPAVLRLDHRLCRPVRSGEGPRGRRRRLHRQPRGRSFGPGGDRRTGVQIRGCRQTPAPAPPVARLPEAAGKGRQPGRSLGA